jgi:apolipoprotein D and lipocalin family protein
MKARFQVAAPALVALALLGCASVPPKGWGPLSLVPGFDAQRYLGRWYEIARFPHGFESSLVGVTAEYSQRSDGKIQVVNSGFKGDLGGPYQEAHGVAWVPDPKRPAALKVRFFWPFSGDYLIFGLDETDYSWALVGDDSRKYLWFLSRTPEISEDLLHKMRLLAESQGYDLSRLYIVRQKAR